ncbi:hypothetical protein DQG13_20015 [Paenibacillus sp. YN15]|nr:hypothetical protein DQG13_20015 [Paenibacillus sp. YN15]
MPLILRRHAQKVAHERIIALRTTLAVNMADERMLRAYFDELAGPREETAQPDDYDPQAVARLRNKLGR